MKLCNSSKISSFALTVTLAPAGSAATQRVYRLLERGAEVAVGGQVGVAGRGVDLGAVDEDRHHHDEAGGGQQGVVPVDHHPAGHDTVLLFWY